MRTSSCARLLIVFLALLAAPESARAQGSWLPYGTVGASDIAVSPKGVVWLVSREANSIQSSLVLADTRFVTPRGSPSRVAVDPNGFPWLVNSDGTLWHWMRSATGVEDWVQSSLKAIDIAVGANGAVWAIDTKQRVVQLMDGAWQPTNETGVRISVDPSGNPWIVNSAGQVSHWHEGTWTIVPASATDISVAPDGSVFILGTTPARGGFEVLRLNGATWEHIVGGGGVAISAGTQAVYVAQDASTYLVVSSTVARLRVAGNDPSIETPPAAASPVMADNAGIASQASAPSTIAPTTTTLSPPTAASKPAAMDPVAPAKDIAAVASAAPTEKGASIPLPSAGTVVGVLGALGGIGGLLSKATPASIAPSVIPALIPSAAAIGGALTNAVSGAASGSSASTGSGGGSGSASSSGKPNQPEESKPAQPEETKSAQPEESKPAQPEESKPAQPEESKPTPPGELNVPGIRPSPKIPLPGNLRCPIIGGGATLERGCELLGRAAMKLRQAPSTDCALPAFTDARNGGECWTCPASFERGTAPVDGDDACVDPANAQHSVATLVKGCSLYKAPQGYGTPFRDSPDGGECYVCPLPLQRSWSAIKNLTKGNLGACFGKAKDLLVWQFSQYPEAGAYRFMPGLLSMALADPKAVDAFLDKRANGDTAVKHELWNNMIADPSGSAELKALLFASLLTVANEDSSTAAAKDALHEFESYMGARRTYVAEEALRMYKKAREVDADFVQGKDSAVVGGAVAEAVGTAATDFKTYAWSAVMPDSAGTAFVLASAALSQFGSGGAEGLLDTGVSALNVRYLAPVTKALEGELDMLHDKGADIVARASQSSVANAARLLNGADPAMIGTTLMGGAMKISKGVMSFFGKDKVAAEYEKYVEEMSGPVRVKEMLESTKPEDRQSLLLYWALATSAHKASDTIGSGAITGAELCTSDAWTTAECASAKAMIEGAAKVVGY